MTAVFADTYYYLALISESDILPACPPRYGAFHAP